MQVHEGGEWHQLLVLRLAWNPAPEVSQQPAQPQGLTRGAYSTSSPSSPVSLRVYLAFFCTASTGPFST